MSVPVPSSPYTHSNSYSIRTNSSTVVLQDIIKFKRGGKVVGKLDATIDFKDLSPEFHDSAIKLLQQKPMTLCLPTSEPLVESTVPSSSNSVEHRLSEGGGVGGSWFQKIKKYLGLL